MLTLGFALDGGGCLGGAVRKTVEQDTAKLTLSTHKGHAHTVRMPISVHLRIDLWRADLQPHGIGGGVRAPTFLERIRLAVHALGRWDRCKLKTQLDALVVLPNHYHVRHGLFTLRCSAVW